MASALSSELVATKAERPVWSAATAWAPLLGLPAAAGLLAAAAAGATDGTYLPGERGVWPAGYRSPLAALGLALTPGLFLALTVVLVLLYLILLRTAGRLPFAAVAACLACAYALLAAGPPLLSRDVFGYIGYARMVAVHGLNPYVQTPSAMAGDPVLPLMGWPHQPTPYGPLFTALSAPLALLPPVAAYWAFKAILAAAALAAVLLLAAAANRRGLAPARAAIAFGANPAYLELMVGGDHNDGLVLAAICLCLLFLSAPTPRPRAGLTALVGATALKLSAAVVPTFLLAHPPAAANRPAGRGRLLLYTAACAALAAAASLALFGVHAFGFLDALGAEQRIVSPHSLPSEAAIALGLGGPPLWLKASFLAAFAALALHLLVETWRGRDWIAACGLATCGLLLATAWFVPWYATWPLPFAALAQDRRLRVAAVAISLYALTFHLPYLSPLLGSPGHQLHPRLGGS